MEKNPETFDRKRLPPRVYAALSVLLDGTFLGRTENVRAFDDQGSGTRRRYIDSQTKVSQEFDRYQMATQ